MKLDVKGACQPWNYELPLILLSVLNSFSVLKKAYSYPESTRFRLIRSRQVPTLSGKAIINSYLFHRPIELGQRPRQAERAKRKRHHLAHSRTRKLNIESRARETLLFATRVGQVTLFSLLPACYFLFYEAVTRLIIHWRPRSSLSPILPSFHVLFARVMMMIAFSEKRRYSESLFSRELLLLLRTGTSFIGLSSPGA